MHERKSAVIVDHPITKSGHDRMSRRSFLKLLGASLFTLGTEACNVSIDAAFPMTQEPVRTPDSKEQGDIPLCIKNNSVEQCADEVSKEKAIEQILEIHREILAPDSTLSDHAKTMINTVLKTNTDVLLSGDPELTYWISKFPQGAGGFSTSERNEVCLNSGCGSQLQVIVPQGSNIQDLGSRAHELMHNYFRIQNYMNGPKVPGSNRGDINEASPMEEIIAQYYGDLVVWQAFLNRKKNDVTFRDETRDSLMVGTGHYVPQTLGFLDSQQYSVEKNPKIYSYIRELGNTFAARILATPTPEMDVWNTYPWTDSERALLDGVKVDGSQKGYMMPGFMP